MITLDGRLTEKFPDLEVVALEINDVKVQKKSSALEHLKLEVAEEISRRYDLEALRNDERVRRYRDFFWRLGIDPTKNRPASEALIRRVLQGKPVPTINTAVDAYNLASMKHNVAIGSFDLDKFRGPLMMRWASPNEEFTGIGMNAPKILTGKEIVISDDEKLVAIYPYRDSDATKVTMQTSNVLSLMCGVPGIERGILRDAADTTITYITQFCGGSGRTLGTTK
ncbi:MAG: B3/4 domain-containing protein [Thermoplasmata archaeon]